MEIENKDKLRETMNVVIAGHVDHGKSTVIGRLLADTCSLPKGKLEQVRSNCERNSKPFEYAFLIDALKDEQAQGITIDSARVFFKTSRRNYIIIDAPGHIEFLKNMVTGASRAEAALLVIDAVEGVQENSKRHGYMLAMLGIKQIVVLVNKMDCVSYRRDIFEKIVEQYRAFLAEINLSPICFIPVSASQGINIKDLSGRVPWYTQYTVLQALDSFEKQKDIYRQPFRMPVQDVYKFTKFGDNRRIVAGTVESGEIKVDDDIIFYPSGKKNRIKSIEVFNKPFLTQAGAGCAIGLTLDVQSYIKRGEIVIKESQLRPKVSSRVGVSLFWLGKNPMVKNKEYIFKLGTDRVAVMLEEIKKVIDSSNLHLAQGKEQIDRHDVGECILKFKRGVAFDLVSNISSTSRFVIVDGYEITGGGVICEALEDKQDWIREKVFVRNYKWEVSAIAPEERIKKYNQSSLLIFLTGKKDVGKKTIAKKLEVALFNEGKIVYFLGIGNVLYGVDADIKGEGNNHQEHIRRLAEVANIMLDAGLILIVTAIELTQEDAEIIKATIPSDKIKIIWIGQEVTTDISCDLQIDDTGDLEAAVSKVRKIL